ncbi:(2,3-dihydroxybenzoyl)adenylate synthase [Qaidamihabitans albus]|uniref:(2,3-dihydroxybenzoyl)adenylate synthase n=1 Tax=Qaidamihabitans albus TaxID=2795733 RepID=UPI0018F260B5|nr:AMP-binding protein [Qaidamihabitans albus]
MLEGTVPVPHEFADRYRSEGLWTGRTLADLARPQSRMDGTRTAVVTARGRMSYRELDERADRLAAGLAGIGLRAADRVVVALPNRPEFLVTCLALFRLGVIPVLALPSDRRAELAYLCEHTDAAALVVPDVHQRFDHRALAREVRAEVPALRHVLVAGEPDGLTGLDELERQAGTARPEVPDPAPSDVALLLLSGGTSGRPKLIPRTHDDYALQGRAAAAVMGFDERGVYLAALPAAHNAALGCPGVLGALQLGARVVLASSPSPDEVFPLLYGEGVTLTTLMPAHLALWTDAVPLLTARAEGLVAEVGGAMLDPAAARKAEEALGLTVSRWFGISEGVLCCTRPGDPADVRLETDGRPICPADETRIVDGQGDDVPDGAEGELLLRGPYTLRGYYRAPEQNAVSFTADGFFRTGDVVRRTAGGNIVVCGRIKDVINRGGEKVAAEEVERHVRTHPAVAEASAVAVPDRSLGEKTCVFVTAADGLDPPTLRELRLHLAERGCADHKLPDHLRVVAELPRTSIGKVDKKRLRGEFTGTVPAGGTHAAG